MNISNYNGTQNGRSRLKKRRITGLFIIAGIVLLGAYIIGILTSDEPQYRMRATVIEENHVLKEQIAELESEIEDLKAELRNMASPEPTEKLTSPRQTEE